MPETSGLGGKVVHGVELGSNLEEALAVAQQGLGLPLKVLVFLGFHSRCVLWEELSVSGRA